jgi:hypothetical protein
LTLGTREYTKNPASSLSTLPQVTIEARYRTRLLLTVAGEHWEKDLSVPIAPFPGMGLRVDTYDVLNVTEVTVGAAGHGIEAVVEEDEPASGFTERQCLAFGFHRGTDPTPSGSATAPTSAPEQEAVHATLVVVDGELGTWQRPVALPFPPFAGLRIRLDCGTLLSVFTIVVGDRHGLVTCIATFDEAHRPRSEEDLEAKGFEESLYP